MRHILAGVRTALRCEIAFERMSPGIGCDGTQALIVLAREHEDP